MFARVEHPGIGTLLTAGSPLGFGAATRVDPGVAPAPGRAHEGRAGVLGRPFREEIAALARSGVLGARELA